MQMNYTGRWERCSTDLNLIMEEFGIKVWWQVEVNGKKGKWQPLKNEYQIRRAWRFGSYESEPTFYVSYRIPEKTYPLAVARDREIYEMFNEQFRQEHLRWIEEEARKLEAYLAKHPGAANQDCGFDMAGECAAGYIYDNQIAPETRTSW